MGWSGRRTGCRALALAIVGLLALASASDGSERGAPRTRHAPHDPSGAPVGAIVPGSVADTTCDSGKGCVWTNVDFTGSKSVFGTADAGTTIILGSYDASAKNSFGNRRMRFFASNGDFLSCINGGNSDRSLNSRTYRLDIGAIGVTC